jgi:hypothetical protein
VNAVCWTRTVDDEFAVVESKIGMPIRSEIVRLGLIGNRRRDRAGFHLPRSGGARTVRFRGLALHCLGFKLRNIPQSESQLLGFAFL